jgi:hypothetical protein
MAWVEVVQLRDRFPFEANDFMAAKLEQGRFSLLFYQIIGYPTPK